MSICAISRPELGNATGRTGFFQVIYGKYLARKGGPVSAEHGDYQFSDWPEEVPEAFRNELFKKRVEFRVLSKTSWDEYRWRNDGGGCLLHFLEVDGQRWAVVMREKHLLESEQGRLFKHSHFWFCPAEEWRWYYFLQFAKMPTEPLVFGEKLPATMEVEQAVPDAELAEGWIQDNSIFWRAILSSKPILVASDETPPEFLRRWAIICSALPSVVADALSVGVGLDEPRGYFDVAHALRFGEMHPNPEVAISGKKIQIADEAVLIPGNSYSPWLVQNVGNKKNLQQVASTVDRRLGQYLPKIDPGAPLVDRIVLLREELEEATYFSDLAHALDDPTRIVTLPKKEIRRKKEAARMFWRHFTHPKVQPFLLQSLHWGTDWDEFFTELNSDESIPDCRGYQLLKAMTSNVPLPASGLMDLDRLDGSVRSHPAFVAMLRRSFAAQIPSEADQWLSHFREAWLRSWLRESEEFVLLHLISKLPVEKLARFFNPLSKEDWSLLRFLGEGGQSRPDSLGRLAQLLGKIKGEEGFVAVVSRILDAVPPENTMDWWRLIDVLKSHELWDESWYARQKSRVEGIRLLKNLPAVFPASLLECLLSQEYYNLLFFQAGVGFNDRVFPVLLRSLNISVVVHPPIRWLAFLLRYVGPAGGRWDLAAGALKAQIRLDERVFFSRASDYPLAMAFAELLLGVPAELAEPSDVLDRSEEGANLISLLSPIMEEVPIPPAELVSRFGSAVQLNCYLRLWRRENPDALPDGVQSAQHAVIWKSLLDVVNPKMQERRRALAWETLLSREECRGNSSWAVTARLSHFDAVTEEDPLPLPDLGVLEDLKVMHIALLGRARVVLPSHVLGKIRFSVLPCEPRRAELCFSIYSIGQWGDATALNLEIENEDFLVKLFECLSAFDDREYLKSLVDICFIIEEMIQRDQYLKSSSRWNRERWRVKALQIRKHIKQLPIDRPPAACGDDKP